MLRWTEKEWVNHTLIRVHSIYEVNKADKKQDLIIFDAVWDSNHAACTLKQIPHPPNWHGFVKHTISIPSDGSKLNDDDNDDDDDDDADFEDNNDDDDDDDFDDNDDDDDNDQDGI